MIRILTLSEVCTQIVDCPHESPDWKSFGIPVIRNFNLVDGRIDMSDGYYVDEETYEKRTKRAVPQAGDIIFSREAPIGNCGIVPENFKCCLGQRLVLLKINRNVCSPEYLLSVLLSDYVKRQIEQVAKLGSIVSNFAIGDLYKLSIPILENQDEVASVSSHIRSKIANNNNICSDLEAMSKLLYDYWFVQFDFPNEEGKPYKSSGGKMVWNEELKRQIPEGWTVSELGSCLKTLLGGTPATGKPEYWNGDIPWLNSGEVATSPVIKAEKRITKLGMDNSATAFAKAGAVVISITRYIRPSILGIDACFNQSVVAIVPNSKLRTAYIYPFMNSMVDIYLSLRTGAQQPHINKEIVDKTVIILPPDNLLERYYEQAEKFYDLQLIKTRENQELCSIRDFLLPMLMNGQVKINAPISEATK